MMARRRWTVQFEPQVSQYLDDAEDVVEHAIRRDLKKLSTRGLKASQSDLVSHLDEGVWYVRTNISVGAYRVFYFRNDERSFRAFYAWKKESQAIPDYVRQHVMDLYREITGGDR